jgi:hypothetical protein
MVYFFFDRVVLIVLTHPRAILHDEHMFPSPFSFRPERFLAPDLHPRALATIDHAFGFGRRICPGRWVAQSFVWITMVHVLATLGVEKARDADGAVLEPSGAYSGGIMGCVRVRIYLPGGPSLRCRTPEPFQCHVKPRSSEAEYLIKSTE